jgi:hypothetical protein
MQKIEFENRPGLDIYCPFCGAMVKSDEGLKTCDHVLYHASDYGFEYVKPDIGFAADVDLQDMSVDEYTDNLEIGNTVKFAIYDPAPGAFGGYVAFQDK